jgi:hypothetical protein
MRRLFWLVMGVTIGALVVRKLSRAAEKLAESVGAGLSALAQSIGDFSGDVRAAMRERESQLREGAGLDAAGLDAAGGDATNSAGR